MSITAITRPLVVVGALNWGLVSVAKFDLVATLTGETFGSTNAATRLIYGLVGVAAVAEALQLAQEATA